MAKEEKELLLSGLMHLFPSSVVAVLSLHPGLRVSTVYTSYAVPEIIWVEFIIISMQKGQSQLPHEFITRELFPYIHLVRVSPK